MELSVASIVLAAKQHEIEELKRLAGRARFVGDIGKLIHALQNERGATCIFLASAGERFGARRLELLAASEASERRLRDEFQALLAAPSCGRAQLLSLMAWVVLGLDGLPELRQRIGQRRISADSAEAAISRLIGGLVSLIFEVADTSVDPAISRLLVGLCNFVQGMEFAGQERAVGSLCFASGVGDVPHQQRVAHLIDAQERCFQLFGQFSEEAVASRWREMQLAPGVAQLERLRRVLLSAPAGSALDANLSQIWFDCCSERLAGMWTLQFSLVDELQARGEALIATAERDLRDASGLLKALREGPPPGGGGVDGHLDPPVPPQDALGAGGHSLMEVLRAQSARLASMEAELDAARRALQERKTVERAKGVLMAHLNLTEEAAYKALRTQSMEQNRRLVEVAEATLSLSALMARPAAPHKK